MSQPDSNNGIILHVSASAQDVRRGIAAAERVADALSEASVEVVVNGDAITGLTQVRAEDIPDSIVVKACSIALHSHGMGAVDIPSNVDVVASGVVYIAQREFAGAHYIRV